MNIPTQPLVIDRAPQLDNSFWELYDQPDHLALQTSDILLPNAELLSEQKRRFFESGYTVAPDLRPKAIDMTTVDRAETQLLEGKRSLPYAEGPEDIRQAYRWRLNERIADLRMLRAVASGDMGRFDLYNEFVYGQPRSDIFAASTDWFCALAESHMQHSDKDVRQAAATVLNFFSDFRGSKDLIIPDTETFANVRDLHYRKNGYFTQLLAGVALDADLDVDPTTGEAAIARVNENIGGQYEREFTERVVWGLDQEKRTIKGPSEYAMTYDRFVGLVLGHEIGSHGLEATNGERSPIQLLKSGLDRYQDSNEGRALIREQIVYRTFAEFAVLKRWHTIVRRHLATSLAFGQATMGEPTGFSDTFQKVHAVDRLYNLLDNLDKAKAERIARNSTWNLLKDIYKGTEGKGRPYLRYKLYLEGHALCWEAARGRPWIIAEGDRGKFSITNPRHRALLSNYGILPKEANEIL